MKGFVLSKVLVLIVFVSFITVVGVPTILSVIEDTRKQKFENTVYSFLERVEKKLVQDGELISWAKYEFLENKATVIEGPELNIDEVQFESGNLIITRDGKIELAVWDGKHCFKKNDNEQAVKLEKEIAKEQCFIVE